MKRNSVISKKRTVFITAVLMMIICAVMTVSAASVTLKANGTKTKKLPVGQKVTLKISGKSSGIKWKSSKKTVASVSAKGVVTAKKAGTATITGKVGGTSYKCKIKVYNHSWKYGNIGAYASAWNDAPNYSQGGGQYDIRLKVYELTYNSKGELVARVALWNGTGGRTYSLEKMHLEIKTAEGTVIASKDFYWTGQGISPQSVRKVKVTFSKKATKKVIDLNKNNYMYWFGSVN